MSSAAVGEHVPRVVRLSGAHLQRAARTGHRRGLARDFSRSVPGGVCQSPAHKSSAIMERAIPARWVGGLASPDLHALLLLFAQDPAERARRVEEHRSLLGSSPAWVSCPSWMSTSRQRGASTSATRTGSPRSASRAPAWSPRRAAACCQARRVRAGLPRRDGLRPDPPPAGVAHPQRQLEVAYRRLYQDVAAFRQFLRQNAPTRKEQELLAAKLMGRWRSGAPLVLAPHRDDPDLVADPQRSNNFDYGQMDPRGTGLSRRRAHPPRQPARHDHQHAAAAADPHRTALRPAAARREPR